MTKMGGRTVGGGIVFKKSKPGRVRPRREKRELVAVSWAGRGEADQEGPYVKGSGKEERFAAIGWKG